MPVLLGGVSVAQSHTIGISYKSVTKPRLNDISFLGLYGDLGESQENLDLDRSERDRKLLKWRCS